MSAIWVSRINKLLADKSRRERRDVTIDELAAFVGVSRQTLFTWRSMKGVLSIPAAYTAKMCEFFDCNFWDLWELVTEDDAQGQWVACSVS